jgi:hypothetical protein
MGFGETAAKQQISLALVSFAGGDGHGKTVTNSEEKKMAESDHSSGKLLGGGS